MGDNFTPVPWEAIERQSNRNNKTWWEINKGSLQIAIIADISGQPSKANAQFIVKACNAHDELYEALDKLIKRLYHNAQQFHELPELMQNELINEGRQALAKADGFIKPLAV